MARAHRLLLFLAVALLLVLGSATGRSLGMEQHMTPPIDEQFSDAMKKTAVVREQNRSTRIDVTSLFEPILQSHSAADFADFVKSKYGIKPYKAVNKRGEYTEIKWEMLKSFSYKFFRFDFVRITFIFGRNGAVSSMTAFLFNDNTL